MENEEELRKKIEKSFIQKFVSKGNLLKIGKDKTRDSLKRFEHEGFKQNVEDFNNFLIDERNVAQKELGLYKHNRQFITEVFYELLDQGFRKIREVNPSDPFEFLVF